MFTRNSFGVLAIESCPRPPTAEIFSIPTTCHHHCDGFSSVLAFICLYNYNFQALARVAENPAGSNSGEKERVLDI